MSRQIEHSPAPHQTLKAHWDDVEGSLQWFADLMWDKFDAVDHKGHWQYVGWEYLHERLCAEIEELRMSIETTRHRGPAGIIDECVDVANCAFMLADWFRSYMAGLNEEDVTCEP